MEDRLDAYRRLIADVYELAGASRRTSEKIAAEVGHTAARWHVMSVVSDGPRTVPAIARRLGQSRQGVQRVVNDLAATDVVALEDNPDHARSPLVSLTPDGHALLERLLRRSAASRTALLDRSGLAATELAGARQVLRALLDAFDDEVAQSRALLGGSLP